ncbi:RNA polymerase sigma-70 factor [Daejeonella sp.]|uniref:RNA polymerase sigma-70 factor n=1 Tax=Daejeonella sp. TaxID=2805397 RepID=UPI0039835473
MFRLKQSGLINESDLICLLAQGNEQAFRKIFDCYSNKLFNYTFRITDNEELAEEIVMDTFLKIWINRADLVLINRFDAYLYTLVRNQAFNAIKRRAHEAAILKDLSLNKSEYQDCTEETVIYNDYKHLLHDAVNQLPPQQRLVYTLSRDQGLKYNEIANQLELSKNTVKTHLKKAVSTLRIAFTNYIVLAIMAYLPM